MSETQQAFYHLGMALAIGLLIGLERGWKERAAEEGHRVAGLRTFGLIGLLGGCSVLLAEHLGLLVVGLAFLGLAGVLSAVYVANLRRGTDDVGITTLVAGLIAFVLGALAAEEEAAAAAFAVVATLLLTYKPVLHRWLAGLTAEELRAGLKLLLISVVLLPILPDRGFGPWQAVNPYAIWWMVILIASISFVGYFAVKLGGASRGAAFTGLFGGLASSTALTVHFSRMTQGSPALAPILATGILLACGTMMPRMVLIASLLDAELLPLLLVPAVTMTAVVYGPALWYWRSWSGHRADTGELLKNPLELRTAVSFGLLLALVMVAGKALESRFGATGVLALAAASGIVDVDAITISLARMSQDDVTLRVAAMGMVIAASVNTVVKGGIAAFVGGSVLRLRVGLPLLASAAGGLFAAWAWFW